VMRRDPRYVKETVLTHMQVSPGGDLRDLYEPGMTLDEADEAMRRDPRRATSTPATRSRG